MIVATNHGRRVAGTSGPNPDGEVVATRRREKFALRIASDVVRSHGIQPGSSIATRFFQSFGVVERLQKEILVNTSNLLARSHNTACSPSGTTTILVRPEGVSFVRLEDALRRRRPGDAPPAPPSDVDLWELRLAKRRWAERNGAKLPPFDTTGAPVEFLLRHPEIEPNVDVERQERNRIQALEIHLCQYFDMRARGRTPSRWPFDGGDVPEAFFAIHPEAREIMKELNQHGR